MKPQLDRRWRIGVDERPYDIAVVGGGGAGTMAFLRASLNLDRTVLFEGDSATRQQARATWAPELDATCRCHRDGRRMSAATGEALELLDRRLELRDVARSVPAAVSRIELRDGKFALLYEDRRQAAQVRARFVILATGAVDVLPRIGGSIAPISPYADRGDVLYCARCDAHRTIGHRLGVIGHDDRAVGVATLMIERYGHERVDVLTHGHSLQLSAEFAALAETYGLEFRVAPIVRVLGDPDGEGLRGYLLGDGTVVEVERTIVALGTVVHSHLFRELGGEVGPDGRVLVDRRHETSIPNLFAVGEVSAGCRVELFSAWDQAVSAADEINGRLRAARARPGAASIR
jgi:thioredoxin reductase (NADPH)